MRYHTARPILARIMVIGQALRANAWPNSRSQGAKLGADPRTIRRDFDYLRDQLHAPIDYDRVRHGYYYTEPTFRLSFPQLGIPDTQGFAASPWGSRPPHFIGWLEEGAKGARTCTAFGARRKSLPASDRPLRRRRNGLGRRWLSAARPRLTSAPGPSPPLIQALLARWPPPSPFPPDAKDMQRRAGN
jgi:hypothetical protein